MSPNLLENFSTLAKRNSTAMQDQPWPIPEYHMQIEKISRETGLPNEEIQHVLAQCIQQRIVVDLFSNTISQDLKFTHKLYNPLYRRDTQEPDVTY